MSRKHYRAIAEAISSSGDHAAELGFTVEEYITVLVNRLSDVFARDNPGFNRELFQRASHAKS